MKQLSQQKWVLSALLVAALGSQYYFSTSSKSLGSYDLSSEAPNAQVDALVEITAALQHIKPQSSKVAATNIPETPKARTEAANKDAPCADCVVLSKEQAEITRKALLKLIETDKDTKKVAIEEETAAEKRKREREEREQAKLEAKQIKEDKLRDEKEARNEDFQDKVEALADKCKDDVSCLSTRFPSLLSRYSGNKKIDLSVVQKAFRKYIEPTLKASLEDDSKREEASSALQDFMTDVPTEYRQIKESAIASVKKVITDRAISINSNYKLAEQLTKANKPGEALQARQQAFDEQQVLSIETNLYGRTISQSLKDVSDSVTAAYMSKNFTPDVQKIFANISNSSGLGISSNTDASGNPEFVDPNQNTSGRGLVRGGGTDSNNGNKMTTPGNNVLNGIQFGSPQTGGRSGGRGSY